MAGNDRKPLFELHILPLMRLLDHEKMLQKTGIDLFDYNMVVDKADSIQKHIQSDMPPNPFGGLWPREWVDLFKRWMDEGCGQLELGTASAPYQAFLDSSGLTLFGSTNVPHETYEAWIEPKLVDGAWREYIHYWQPPDVTPNPPLSPREVLFEEPVPLQAGVNVIVVIDAGGRHDVPITGESAAAGGLV